jgi:hypothetical protein
MSDMDEETIKFRRLFENIEENEVEDDLMNVSGGSTDKDEVMLRFIETSSKR